MPMQSCVLVRPGVSMAMPAEQRTDARRRFGYAGGHRVIFVPVPRVGHDRALAVWTGVLLNVLDDNVRLLLWSEGGRAGLRSLRSRLIAPATCSILEDDSPDAGFAAADAILLPPAEIVPPTLVAMAMASGKPIVGRATPQVCELLEDRHTALLTNGRTPKILADRVIDLFADAAQARRIADRARAEAYEHLLLSRLVADFRTLYATAGDAANGVSPPAAVDTV